MVKLDIQGFIQGRFAFENLCSYSRMAYNTDHIMKDCTSALKSVKLLFWGF